MKNFTDVEFIALGFEGPAEPLASTVVIRLELYLRAHPTMNQTVRGNGILLYGTDNDVLILFWKRKENLPRRSAFCSRLPLFVPFRDRPFDTRSVNDKILRATICTRTPRGIRKGSNFVAAPGNMPAPQFFLEREVIEKCVPQS